MKMSDSRPMRRPAWLRGRPIIRPTPAEIEAVEAGTTGPLLIGDDTQALLTLGELGPMVEGGVAPVVPADGNTVRLFYLPDLDLAVAVKRVDAADLASLDVDERRSMKHFVERMRVQMASARASARVLFDAVGIPAQSLPHREGGPPRWPKGWLGSLTHSPEAAAAAISPAATGCGIGLDIETIAAVDGKVFDAISTEREKLMIADQPVDRASLFCGKEAAYKAVHPLDGVWREPTDIEVDLDGMTAQLAEATGFVQLQRIAADEHVLMAARTMDTPPDEALFDAASWAEPDRTG